LGYFFYLADKLVWWRKRPSLCAISMRKGFDGCSAIARPCKAIASALFWLGT
jgi:hypothetical protein